MDEERVLEEQIEEITNVEQNEYVVDVDNSDLDITIQSDIVTAEIENEELIELVVEESVGGTNLNIITDHYVDWPNQHTIGAITGLRQELDEIERLKTVYSDFINHANYYMWEDENPNGDNRDGLFVSMSKEYYSRIKICASYEGEFGVTVSSAGFVGGQDVVGKDDRYSLVVHSGVVGVRCESDVNKGDYVVPNNGVAAKTDGTYGYLVSAISNIGDLRYATISLNVPSTQMQKFSETVKDVDIRMDSAEINIATAISVANAAYNKAQNTVEYVNGNNEFIGGQLGDIIDRVENMEGQVGSFGESFGSISEKTIEAYNIAQSAVNTSENIRQEAVKTANEAQASVNDLMQDVAPILEWEGADGNKGADYLVKYIKEGLATKTEISHVENMTNESSTAISKNAKEIELLASSIDKYSVGEFSQAYGLTLSQANDILRSGMIYIPTTEHDEAYSYIVVDEWSEEDKDPNVVYNIKDTTKYYYCKTEAFSEDGEVVEYKYTWYDVEFTGVYEKQEFTRGYYYIWNGYYWVESESPIVYFSSEYVLPSEQCLYWYRDTNENLEHQDDVTGEVIAYEANALYVLIDNKWTKVNILDGNVTNRVVSAIRQTANQVSIEVANARGDIAALEAKVDAGGATTAMMASVVTQFKDSDGNPINITGNPYASKDDISAIDGKYYAVGESAPYDIYTLIDGELTKITYLYYDGVDIKKPNTASIVAAVNKDGDTSIALNADRINFDGVVTFTEDDSGVTTIKGGGIRSGYIASNNFKQIGDFVESGTLIDLNNGSIYTPNFMLDQYGNVSMAGRISATSGYIGNGNYGFVIGTDNEWIYNGELIDGNYYCFNHNGVNYYFQAPDYIDGSVLVFNANDLSLKYGEDSVDYDNREYSAETMELIELENNHYYIGNGQHSLYGDNTGEYAGIYMSYDGIGLGNGNFVVDNYGNLTTYGSVSMFGQRENEYGDIITDKLVSIDGGNLTLSGNIMLAGSIVWNESNSPSKVLYSMTSTSKPVNYGNDGYIQYDNYPEDYEAGSVLLWHRTYAKNDYYASYSYDGGLTWTEIVKIQGSDATATVDYSQINSILKNSYNISKTSINEAVIESPTIKAATIYSPEIYAYSFTSYIDPDLPVNNSIEEPGFNLIMKFANRDYNFFNINCSEDIAPYVSINSPGGANVYWTFDKTFFEGSLNFTNASITGLTITFS